MNNLIPLLSSANCIMEESIYILNKIAHKFKERVDEARDFRVKEDTVLGYIDSLLIRFICVESYVEGLYGCICSSSEGYIDETLPLSLESRLPELCSRIISVEEKLWVVKEKLTNTLDPKKLKYEEPASLLGFAELINNATNKIKEHASEISKVLEEPIRHDSYQWETGEKLPTSEEMIEHYKKTGKVSHDEWPFIEDKEVLIEIVQKQAHPPFTPKGHLVAAQIVDRIEYMNKRG